MAGTSRFELNYAGVGELLRSGEMRSVIEAYTDAVLSNAGANYGSQVKLVKDRWAGYVDDRTPEGKQDNLDNNTLLKSLRG